MCKLLPIPFGVRGVTGVAVVAVVVLPALGVNGVNVFVVPADIGVEAIFNNVGTR